MDFTGLRYLTDLQLHGGRWADTHLAELIERLGDQLLNLGRIFRGEKRIYNRPFPCLNPHHILPSTFGPIRLVL